MIYQNAFGHRYELTKLEYLLTEIQLEQAGGTRVVIASEYQEDLFAILPGKSESGLAQEVPTGEYTKVIFQWGQRWRGSIEDTERLPSEYDGLKWPDHLGGGYHVMRFEGNYESATEPVESGSFKLHTGRLHATVPQTDPVERYDRVVDGSVLVELDLPQGFTVDTGDIWNIEIVIDVNQFMTEDYDFTREVDTESGRGTFPLSGPVMPSYPAQELLREPIDADADGEYDGGTVFTLGDVEHIRAD
jgi:hypothetical protein